MSHIYIHENKISNYLIHMDKGAICNMHSPLNHACAQQTRPSLWLLPKLSVCYCAFVFIGDVLQCLGGVKLRHNKSVVAG